MKRERPTFGEWAYRSVARGQLMFEYLGPFLDDDEDPDDDDPDDGEPVLAKAA